MKWVRRFGESFNMDSEQEMYFIEKKKNKQTQTNMEYVAEGRIYI